MPTEIDLSSRDKRPATIAARIIKIMELCEIDTRVVSLPPPHVKPRINHASRRGSL